MPTESPTAVAAATESPEAVDRYATRERSLVVRTLDRHGVLLAMVATTLVFVVLRAGTFATGDNVKTILTGSAPLAVIGFGLTVVLVMGDFDLSFGAVVGLVGGITISLMAKDSLPWALAALAGLGAGCLVGVVNGALTAYLGAAAFIVTLAVSTAVTGFEFLITDQKSIYDGVSNGYAQIGQGELLGFNYQIWIALAVFAIVFWLLEQTETGRRMYAVGSSPVAASLAGLRVPRLRATGFVIAGLMAAVAGIMVSAQNAAYTPNQGVSLLLPAYAAAFLGTTVLRRGRFGAVGTLIGTVFLGIVQNGLILLEIDTAWVNVAQGGILLGAILAAKASQR